MSFRMRQEQSIRKNIRRIVRNQLETALEHLTERHNGRRNQAVHEGRKCFKRIRAVLRLVRPKIDKGTYSKENTAFRDAARPLSEIRDAKILIDALDGLVKHFAGHIDERDFAHVRKVLQNHLRDVRRRVLDQESTLSDVTKIIREAQHRIADLSRLPNRWFSVGRGLQETYRRACDAFGKAEADPTVENLHEWRKQTKYLRYQLQLLSPVWPERMDELADEADRLGTMLGDDHDLTVLRQMLTDEPDRYGNEQDRELALALIDRRRDELCQQALSQGTRFFLERPDEFVAPLKSYWKTWRAEEAACFA